MVVKKEFIEALTAAQSSLYSEIVSMMGAPDEAGDVLQETNIALCSKAEEFDHSRPFIAWARRFAYWQVKKWRLEKAREGKFVVFDDTVFDAIAHTLLAKQSESEPQTDRLAALEHCLSRLDAEERRALEAHYKRNVPLSSLAKLLNRNDNALAARFYRIRKSLAECINRKVCSVHKQCRGGGLICEKRTPLPKTFRWRGRRVRTRRISQLSRARCRLSRRLARAVRDPRTYALEDGTCRT